MKKIYLTLLAAAAAVVACDKSESLNQENGQKQQEITLNPVNLPATKAPIATTTFPDDNVIYVSASNNKSKFFEDKTFKKDGAVWKNFVGTTQTPLYWPLGGAGSFDFLAYSTTLAATASWGDGNPATDDDVAGKVEITYPDNYGTPGTTTASQDDLLYATTSSASRTSALPIEFKHALAWVNFEVNASIPVNISKIELVDVFTEGTFTVDQTANTPQISWDFTGLTAADKAILTYGSETTANAVAGVDIDGTTNAVSTDHEFGDKGILVPAQPIPNFKITYDMRDGNDLVYVVNSVRGTWESGKKYTYKLNITFNEITLAPSVVVYDAVTAMPINL